MVQPYILERIHTRIPQMVMSSFTHVQISNAKTWKLCRAYGSLLPCFAETLIFRT